MQRVKFDTELGFQSHMCIIFGMLPNILSLEGFPQLFFDFFLIRITR